jgi:hypothetical protein
MPTHLILDGKSLFARHKTLIGTSLIQKIIILRHTLEIFWRKKQQE